MDRPFATRQPASSIRPIGRVGTLLLLAAAAACERAQDAVPGAAGPGATTAPAPAPAADPDQTLAAPAPGSPPPVAIARPLVILADGQAWREVSSDELARLPAGAVPEGALRAHGVADLLRSLGVMRLKSVVVRGDADPAEAEIGSSLIEDAEARPALAVMPDGSVALVARSGALASPARWVRSVRSLDLRESDARRAPVSARAADPAPPSDAAMPDDGQTVPRERERLVVRVQDGASREVSDEEIEALPHETVGRNGRDVDAVPLEALLAHAGLGSGRAVRVIGGEDEVRLEWPAAGPEGASAGAGAPRRSYLYRNQRGSLLLLIDPARAGDSSWRGGTGDSSGAGRRRGGMGPSRAGGHGGGGGGEGGEAGAPEPSEVRDVYRIEVIP